LQQDQRRLAAILAADVAGYSRLMAADEAGTLAQLRRLRAEVIDPKVAAYQGHVVGSAGDSLLIEFASAVNAVQCAVELQAGLAEKNAALPEDRRMTFRMGVNLGDVIAGDGTIHGDGVNIAARLEKLAAPGTVCIGQSILDQIKGKLPFRYDDLGTQRLHNIAEPVRAFRVDAAKPQPGVRPGVKATAAAGDMPSIAVLPFTNMSGDPEQEYFSDGITEDIITELSRYRYLFVIARNSSFTYKGRAANVQEIGRALGVRYVAEGSVRRAGNRVRVTAQLVDARSGNHLWAERYDRDLADIFAVQDEVTRAIVTNIAPMLVADSLQLATRKPPEDMRAYDYYLKAKVLVEMASTAADLAAADELCDRAVAIDATFARAYATKAFSLIVAVMIFEFEDAAAKRALAMQLAEQSVALSPVDSTCNWAVGETAFHLRQYERCRTSMARAISLNPNDAELYLISSTIEAACGDRDLAMRHLTMAIERSPANPQWHNWVRGITLYLLGKPEEAISAFQYFGRPNPAMLKWRTIALVKLGRLEEARADIRSLLAIKPNLNAAAARTVMDYLPACDEYVEALRQAGLPD
jgi:TolB-like protein/class 3 adenylate cyclase/Flp pilus assembly protein TadD